jgi:hypothetical protein
LARARRVVTGACATAASVSSMDAALRPADVDRDSEPGAARQTSSGQAPIAQRL